MSLVSKLLRSGGSASKGSDAGSGTLGALTDGALDTLSTVLRVMGDESFPLESDTDEAAFTALCREFSCHVENGAGVPSFDIPQSEDGSRQWAHVRRFFADRRTAEKKFVSERLHDYRGVVEDLVAGLRVIGQRDQMTETSVIQSLSGIEDAVSTGELPEIRKALEHTVRQVNETFAEQQRQYESQLQELNERMSTLREDLVQAREEMQRDALTEAYNRGAFDAAIKQTVNLRFVLHQPATLIMIDLDQFKNINDSFGHAAGDEVLRAVGECLARSFVRRSDLVARFGGDEFAVILNDTTAANAAVVIERFLRQIEEIIVPYAGGETRVSCSAGYTEVHETDTVESLIIRADRALYKAKAAGRKRAEHLPWAATDLPH